MTPILEITDDPLLAVVERHLGRYTLIVTDAHNYDRLRPLGMVLEARSCDASQIDWMGETQFDAVLAVGGCTALDVGKAAAKARNVDIIAVPTILSTACISTGGSVLREDSRYSWRRTAVPSRTVVSMPALLETDPEKRRKWSSSGFGDLLSRASASVHYQYARGSNLSLEAVRRNVPDVSAILAYANSGFPGYDDRSCLERLARWSHAASVPVNESGSLELSAAGEHELDYAMRKPDLHPKHKPTHGQAVAAGTLLTLRLHGEQAGDLSLYRELREAYRNLGLPADYEGLRSVNLAPGRLKEALRRTRDNGTYLSQFGSRDFRALARAFGAENGL